MVHSDLPTTYLQYIQYKHIYILRLGQFCGEMRACVKIVGIEITWVDLNIASS